MYSVYGMLFIFSEILFKTIAQNMNQKHETKTK